MPGSVEEILGQALPFEGPRLLRGLVDLFHGPESATARRPGRRGAAGSWRSEDVEQRLNAGGAIAWDLPHFTVSLPLSPRIWLEVLDLRDPDAGEALEAAAELAAGMLGRLVTELRPARYYTGLAALDGPTLAWLAEQPRLQSRLYEEDRLAAFADFGRALRIRDGRVETPGGAESAAFWEDLVGASAGDPARFAERLFGAPHLAYAYDLVARLPAARQRFVLATWRPDARARRDSLRSLRRVFRGLPAPAPWLVDAGRRPGDGDPAATYTHRYSTSGRLAARVFALQAAAASARPARVVAFGWEAAHAVDPAAALRAIAVDDSGAPAEPASLAFWTRVFSASDVPEEPDRRLDGIRPRPRIDAAYLLAAAVTGPASAGRARVQVIAFAQRVFGDRAASDPASVFTAARAFARYPMLMLSLERMGVADPRTYAALARAALRIDRLEDPLARRRALSLFQGALALVERARLAGSLSPEAAGRALGELAEARPARHGGFDGAVAAWLAGRLLPDLGVPVEPALGATAMDGRLLAALAGTGPAAPEAPAIEWEGLRYRFDRGAAAFDRLRRARAQLGSNRLDTVMVLAGLSRTSWPAGSTTSTPWRPDRLARPARELRYVVDVLLADLLRTLACVVHLGDAYGTDLLGSDVAARHDFGVHLEPDAGRARAAWLPPWGGAEAPYPFHAAAVAPIEAEDGFNTGWRAYGSLLSLDLAFARMGLVLTPFAPPGGELSLGATLTPDDRQFLALAAALFDPARASEDGPARIGAAVRRGRDRVRSREADAAGLTGLAEAVGMDGARRNEMRWMMRHRAEAPDRYFTRAELFRLGSGAGDSPPSGWGAPALPLDGCLCVRIPEGFGVDLARAGAERLASTYVDLQLALAEAVDDLGLPAAIAADLLPFAVGELVSGARPASAGDVADRGLRGDAGRSGPAAPRARAPPRQPALRPMRNRRLPRPLPPAPRAALAVLAAVAALAAAPPAQEAAPALIIEEPTADAYLVDRVRLRATVTGVVAVEAVEFFVDGAPACAAPTPDFTCAWEAGPRVRARVWSSLTAD